MQKTDVAKHIVRPEYGTQITDVMLRMAVEAQGRFIGFLYVRGCKLSSKLILHLSAIQDVFLNAASRRSSAGE